MRGLTAVVGLLAVLFLGITVAGLAGTDDRDDRPVSGGQQLAEMLESDTAMLEQMRASAAPVMMSMIQEDPMWTDPDMIRAQEEYQAQMDRMLGRRPGGP